MEFWTSILCFSFWTIYHIVVGRFTAYHVDRAFSDKLCSDLAAFEIVLASLLACLAKCSMITDCAAAIHHKGIRTCYILAVGYQYKGCTMEFVGTRVYQKAVLSIGPCPKDWSFRYQSCYRVTGQGFTDKHKSEAICKGFSDKAHLVDMKTKEEFDYLSNLTDWYPMNSLVYWTGATYNNGWTWSDGTPLESWHGLHNPAEDGGGTCLYYYLLPSGPSFMRMGCFVQFQGIQGLCEIDIF